MKRLTAFIADRIATSNNNAFIVSGVVGSGKSSTACNLIASFLVERPTVPDGPSAHDPVDPKSIAIMTPRGNRRRAKLITQLELSTPIGKGSSVQVETVDYMALNVLNSPIGALHGVPSQKYPLLNNRAEKAAFLEEVVLQLKLERFCPKSEPHKYVAHLQEYFSSLVKADVSPEAYLKFAASLQEKTTTTTRGGEESGASSSLLDPAAHVELSRAYDELLKLKKRMGLFEVDDMIYFANSALRSSHVRGKAPALCKAAFGQESMRLLLLDDAHDLTPAELRFCLYLGRMVMDTGGKFGAFGDFEFGSVMSFRGVAQDPERFLNTQLAPFGLRRFHLRCGYNEEKKVRRHTVAELAPLGASANVASSPPPPPPPTTAATAVSRPIKRLPKHTPHSSSYEDLSRWAADHLARSHRVAVVTRSRSDRDEVVAGLRVHNVRVDLGSGEGGGAVGAQEPVAAPTIRLFDSEEVRLMNAFLRAVSSADTDRELYFVLTSRFLPYAPSPGELQQLAELKTRAHLSMRECLGRLECGKRLLADLKRLEEFAVSHSCVDTIFEMFKTTGMEERFANASNEQDEVSSQRMAAWLAHIARAEQRLGKRASVWEIVKHLDAVEKWGGGGGLVDAGAGMEEEEASHLEESARYEASSSEPPLPEHAHGPTKKEPAVLVLTMHAALNELEPYALDALAISHASDSKIPSRRRASRFPLPMNEFLGVPRPEDEIGPEGPFIQGAPLERDEHITNELKLLEAVVARSKMDADLVFSLANAHDRPSRFLGEAATSSPPSSSSPPPPLPNAAMPTSPLTPIKYTGPPATVSYSQLRQYEACPKRYHYARVLSLRAPTNPRMVYGKALHAGVEAHALELTLARKAGMSSESAARAAWERARTAYLSVFNAVCEGAEGWASRQHLEGMRERGLEVLERFSARRRETDASRVEHRFEFEEGSSLKVVGVIDLIEEGDTVVDFKSNVTDEGKMRRVAREAKDQLALYALAHLRLFGRPARAVVTESIETGMRSVEDADKLDHTRIIGKLNALAQKVYVEKDFHATPSHATCSMCSYRNICPDKKTT